MFHSRSFIDSLLKILCSTSDGMWKPHSECYLGNQQDRAGPNWAAFALLCRSICASCMHAVLHLGISNYLHKCVIKAEWEMERLIDLTWVTQWERNQTENYIWQLELRLSMKAWVLCCIRFVILGLRESWEWLCNLSWKKSLLPRFLRWGSRFRKRTQR